MGPGGADSVKSRKYTPMLVRSSPAANILDILVDIQKYKTRGYFGYTKFL